MKKQFEQPEAYLRDILGEMGHIEQFIEGVKSSAELANETKSLYACVRSFEIMGEASKHIPAEFRKKHPNVPWHDMSSMRDKLIHDYGGVNAAVVWKTIHEDLPVLKEEIKKIIARK